MKFEVGQSRPQVHFLIAYSDVGFTSERFREVLDFPCPEMIAKVFEESYTSLFAVKDLKELFNHIEEEILEKPDTFYQQVREKFDQDEERASELLSENYSDDWERVDAALSALERLSIYLSTLRYTGRVSTRRLKQSFDDNNINISDDELFTLTSVDSYLTLGAKEKIDLLKIAIENYDERPESFSEELEEHTERYKNVELHVSTQDPFTVGDFSQRIKRLFDQPKNELVSELDQLKRKNDQLKEDKKAIREKYEFSAFEGSILQILTFISETKVKITDHLCVLNLKLVNSAKKLTQKWGIKEELFYIMFPREIKKYAKKPDIEEEKLNALQKRKTAVVWGKDEELQDVFFGKEASNFLDRKIADEELDTDELAGTPIFEGEVQGTVKVVTSTEELSKVKEGDILVASDTSPDFVPAFKKVAAIITDEGGVISHAAIVAREMEIPCVVGTKNATKVLEDRDEVSIDAEEGIVKRI